MEPEKTYTLDLKVGEIGFGVSEKDGVKYFVAMTGLEDDIWAAINRFMDQRH